MGLRPPLVGLTHDLWGKSTDGGRRPIVGGPRGAGPPSEFWGKSADGGRRPIVGVLGGQGPPSYELAEYFPSVVGPGGPGWPGASRGDQLSSVRRGGPWLVGGRWAIGH